MKSNIINLKNLVVNHPEMGRIIPFGLLGYYKIKTLINDDLLLIPIGGIPSMIILKKGSYNL